MDKRMNVVAITAAEAKSALVPLAYAPLAERARAAFKAARSGMMAPTEDEAFTAGVAAILDLASEDERRLIDAEIAVIGHANRVLQAVATGLPIAWEQMPDAPVMPEDAIGLLELFREAQDG